MTRPIEQIVSQQLAQVAQDVGIARGVEAVAAVVHPNSIQLEAAGIAANGVALFEDGHPRAAGDVSVRRQRPLRPDPRRELRRAAESAFGVSVMS